MRPLVWMMARGHRALLYQRVPSGSAQSPPGTGLFTVICTHCQLVKEKALGEVTQQHLAACHSYPSLGKRILQGLPGSVLSVGGNYGQGLMLCLRVSVSVSVPGMDGGLWCPLHSEVQGMCVPHLVLRTRSMSQARSLI